jgi:hypothetical protein
MPEPRAVNTGPPAFWPDTLPNPDGPGFQIGAGVRTESAEVLFGPTRIAVRARTAPMSFSFSMELTREEMQIFEAWYRDALENHDGEFYAHWIGGSRVVAFSQPYEYSALGAGWTLVGRLVRTRIYDAACDDFIESVFGNIYRADLAAVDSYEADLEAVDIYVPDFALQTIRENEC